jgi:hypothetical protein
LPEIGPQCSKPGHTLAACFDLCQYLVFVVPGGMRIGEAAC